MAVMLFDRYTSKVQLAQKKQQYLAATTCIIVNAKLVEESLAPQISDYLTLTHYQISEKQIRVC
jgi:hypothetical protein